MCQISGGNRRRRVHFRNRLENNAKTLVGRKDVKSNDPPLLPVVSNDENYFKKRDARRNEKNRMTFQAKYYDHQPPLTVSRSGIYNLFHEAFDSLCARPGGNVATTPMRHDFVLIIRYTFPFRGPSLGDPVPRRRDQYLRACTRPLTSDYLLL